MIQHPVTGLITGVPARPSVSLAVDVSAYAVVIEEAKYVYGPFASMKDAEAWIDRHWADDDLGGEWWSVEPIMTPLDARGSSS